jgi:DNA-binding transcriptional ArsR family regulator
LPAEALRALGEYTGVVTRSSISLAAQFDIAAFGELASDASRVRMLLSLMDGQARPASELARIAGVSASTASGHLKKLTLGGLLVPHALGRHRYYRLASDAVADALEALALLRPPHSRATRAVDPKRDAFNDARTCWRHVAGRFGVAFFNGLDEKRLITLRDAELGLSAPGIAFCRALGLERARWPLGKPCVDLTERRFHLGGALGTLLAEQLFALAWIARSDEGRTIRVTSRGSRELQRQLGIRWPPG